MSRQGFQLKRIYDEPSPDDCYRVLVDRLWPRGVSKEAARLDEWNKEVAPSPELRTWFNHDPERFQEFRKRYEAELAGRESLLQPLIELAGKSRITLLYAAKDRMHNHAVVLRDYIKGYMD